MNSIDEALNKGEAWLADHKEHVQRITFSRTSSKQVVQPSGEDLRRPELWKDIHWNWFFQFRSPVKS